MGLLTNFMPAQDEYDCGPEYGVQDQPGLFLCARWARHTFLNTTQKWFSLFPVWFRLFIYKNRLSSIFVYYCSFYSGYEN